MSSDTVSRSEQSRGSQESALAVVASTLATAALFGPLRRRVQAVIDRRFFWRKYDSRQVLAAFNLRAAESTDLDTLTADLAGTVQRTLEPERVALWLLEPGDELNAKTQRR